MHRIGIILPLYALATTLACAQEASVHPYAPPATGSEIARTPAAAPVAPGGTWLYLTSFQTGALYVIDAEGRAVVHSIEVEDGSGLSGLALSSSGERLHVVDGVAEHRVRSFSTAEAELLATVPFEDRALLLGGGPVAHLTRDGAWMFLTTFDYGAAASGMRAVDMKTGVLAPVGLRGRLCDAPKMASTAEGALIQVCPGAIALTHGTGEGIPDFLPEADVETPVEEIGALTLTPDGSELLVLEWIGAAPPWRLVRWPVGADAATTIDLAKHLRISEDDPRGGGSASIAVSHDGRTLALVQNRRAWLLETATLAILHEIELPDTAEGAVFSTDDRAVYSVLLDGDDATLLELSTVDGSADAFTLEGRPLRMTSVQLLGAPAPARR